MSGVVVKNSGLSIVIAKLALDLTKDISNEIRNVGIQSNDTSGPIILTSKAEVNPSVTIGATGTGGGVKLFGDTGGVEITSNNGDINLLANSGTINIGTDSDDGTLNLGSNAGSSATNIDSGTGGTDINTSGTMNIISSYSGNNAISIFASALNNSDDIRSSALLLSTEGNGMCAQILTNGKNASIILDTEGETADINLLTNGTGSKTKISSDTQILLEQTSAESTVSGIILATSATTQTDEPSIVIDASDGASNILIAGGYDTEHGGVTIIGGGGPIAIGEDSSSTTITSVKGPINIEAGSHYTDVGSINISADGTNEDQINITNIVGNASDAINIQTYAIGGGITLKSTTGSITLDDVTPSSGTINIGDTNATVINIGNDGTTTNFLGTVTGGSGFSGTYDDGNINLNSDTESAYTTSIGNTDAGGIVSIVSKHNVSLTTGNGNQANINLTESNGEDYGNNISITAGGKYLTLSNPGSEGGQLGNVNIYAGNDDINVKAGGRINIETKGTEFDIINIKNNYGTDVKSINIQSVNSEYTNAINIQADSGGITLTSNNGGININTSGSDSIDIGSSTAGDITIASNNDININAGSDSGMILSGQTLNIDAGSDGEHIGTININTNGTEDDQISLVNSRGNNQGAVAIRSDGAGGGINMRANGGGIILDDTNTSSGYINIGNSTAPVINIGNENATVNLLGTVIGGGIDFTGTYVAVKFNESGAGTTKIGNTDAGGNVSIGSYGYVNILSDGTNNEKDININAREGGVAINGKKAIFIGNSEGGLVNITTGSTESDGLSIKAPNGAVNIYGKALYIDGVDTNICTSNDRNLYLGSKNGEGSINIAGIINIGTEGSKPITIGNSEGGLVNINAGSDSYLNLTTGDAAVTNDKSGSINIQSEGGSTTYINTTNTGDVVIGNDTGTTNINSDIINIGAVESTGGITIGNTDYTSGININNKTYGINLSSLRSNINIIAGSNTDFNTTSINIKSQGDSNDTILIENTKGTTKEAIILQSVANGGGIQLNATAGGITLSDLGDEEGSAANVKIISGSETNNAPGNISLKTQGNDSDNITITNTLGTGSTAIDLVASAGGITMISTLNGVNINTSGTDNVYIGSIDTESIDILSTDLSLAGSKVNIIGSELNIGGNGEIPCSKINISTYSDTSEQIIITNTKGTKIGAVGSNAIDISAPLGGIQLSSGTNSSDNPGSIVLQTSGVGSDQITISNLYGANAGALTLSCINPSGNMLMETNGGGITINDKNNSFVDINTTSDSKTTIGNTSTGDIVSLNSSTEIDLTSGTSGSSGKIYLLTQATTGDNITIKNTLGNSSTAIDIEAMMGAIKLHAYDGINLDTNGTNPISMVSTAGIDMTDTDGDIKLSIGGIGNIKLLDPHGHIYINSTDGGANNIECYGNETTITGGPIALKSTYNGATALSLTTNGGTKEQIVLSNGKGISPSAIDLVTSEGGITLQSKLGTNISGGDISLTTSGGTSEQIVITNTLGEDTDAIKLLSSVGGITLQSTDGGVNINTTGTDAVNIGSKISEAIKITSEKGISLIATSDTNSGNIEIKNELSEDTYSINLVSTLGGISLKAVVVNMDSTEGITLKSTSNGVNINNSGTDKVNIGSSNAGAITVASKGDISLSTKNDSIIAITLTTNGGTSEKIVLTNTLGEDPDAISLISSAGGITLNGYNGINIDAGQHYANKGIININTDGTDADQILITNTLGIAKDAINIVSSRGGIILNASDATNGIIAIDGGKELNLGIDIADEIINIGSFTAGAITVASKGDISLSTINDSITAITLTTNGDISEKIVLTNTKGEDTDAINLVSLAGGITLNGYNGINIDAGQHYANKGIININTDGTDADQILITNTLGIAKDAINIVSSRGGIILNASDATNGIIAIDGGKELNLGIDIADEIINIGSFTAGAITVASKGDISLSTEKTISLISDGGGIIINDKDTATGSINIGIKTPLVVNIATVNKADGAIDQVINIGNVDATINFLGNVTGLTGLSTYTPVVFNGTHEGAITFNTGGTSSTLIGNTGAGAGPVSLLSNNTILLSSSYNNADAINLVSLAGGITLESTLGGVNINTSGTDVVNIGNVDGTTKFLGTVDLSSATVNGGFSGDFDGNITFNTKESYKSTTVGNTTDGGAISIRSKAMIELNSYRNDADAIYLFASDGGIILKSTNSISINTSGTGSVNIGSANINTNFLGTVDFTGTDAVKIATNGNISLSTTTDNAKAITLTTDGGTSEKIVITNTNGENTDAIKLLSSAGGITLDSTIGTTITGGLILTQKTTTAITANTAITSLYSGSVTMFDPQSTGNIVITLPHAVDMVGQTYTFIQHAATDGYYVQFTIPTGNFLGTIINGNGTVTQLNGTSHDLFFNWGGNSTLIGDWIEFRGISDNYIMVRAVSSSTGLSIVLSV